MNCGEDDIPRGEAELQVVVGDEEMRPWWQYGTDEITLGYEPLIVQFLAGICAKELTKEIGVINVSVESNYYLIWLGTRIWQEMVRLPRPANRRIGLFFLPTIVFFFLSWKRLQNISS